MARFNKRPYAELANGIVLRAAEDFRDGTRTLSKIDMRLPDRRLCDTDRAKKNAALRKIGESIVFFRSDWCKMLTKLDGEFILGRLMEEVMSGEYTSILKETIADMAQDRVKKRTDRKA